MGLQETVVGWTEHRSIGRWAGQARRMALAGLVMAGFALTGCSIPLADLPSPIGLPEGAPARPETPPAFPAVHDVPADRKDSLLDPEEQKRLQRELNNARAIQEGRAGASKQADD
jgi:hypothetical protein